MWPRGRAFQAEGTGEGRCARAGLRAWGSSGKGEWRRGGGGRSQGLLRRGKRTSFQIGQGPPESLSKSHMICRTFEKSTLVAGKAQTMSGSWGTR